MPPHIDVCLRRCASSVSACTDVCACMSVRMCVSCMRVGTPGCLPAWYNLAWHGQQSYDMARPGHCACVCAYTNNTKILNNGCPHSCTRTSHAGTHMCTRTWTHTCLHNVLHTHTHAFIIARPHPCTIACINIMRTPTHNIIHNHSMGTRTLTHTRA